MKCKITDDSGFLALINAHTMIDIVRQTYETSINEIEGETCNQLIGVGTDIFGSMDVFYINVSGTFFRFFIDEEVLFWEKGTPDEGEDLFSGQKYIEISSILNFENKIIKGAYKKGNDFSILFADSLPVILRYDNGETFVVAS